MSIYNWSTNPANNTNVDGINWSEGQLPSTVNNSARQMMADLATFLNNPVFTNPTAGAFGEVQAASNDRSVKMGVRSSTHVNGDLSYVSTPNAVPFAILTGGSERLRVQTNGFVTVNRAAAAQANFHVGGTIKGEGPVGSLTASNGGGAGQTSILIRREGAAADAKDWEIVKNVNGALEIRTLNDTYSASHAAITLNRGSGFVHDSTIFNSNGAQRWQIENAGNFRPWADNSVSVGVPSARVSSYYGVNGAINTSDEREKAWRGEPSEAELRAARRIIKELGFYQWKTSVAEKGPDGARYHFGPRAQRLFEIFRDEGLNPECYGFLCYDKWEASGDAPAGDRYGIRSDQLCMFLLAAVMS